MKTKDMLVVCFGICVAAVIGFVGIGLYTGQHELFAGAVPSVLGVVFSIASHHEVEGG